MVPTVHTYYGLVKGLVNANKFTEALDVISSMKENGIERTRNIYLIIFNSLVKAELPDNAFEVLELLKADSFNPLSYMYNDIVTLYKGQGNTEKARAVEE